MKSKTTISADEESLLWHVENREKYKKKKTSK